MTRRRNQSGRGRNAQSTGTVAVGQQEIAQVTLGSPSGTFVGGQFPLIPTFEPTSRLGVLALQFSQYSVEISRVAFVSQTTTNTSGRIILAWTFDAEDADPVTAHQILQISRARMSPVWKNTSTSMPRNSPEKRRFAVIDAATFAGLSGQDKQIYTPATLVFGSDGSAQSGLIVGSLIWHYKIRFYNPNVQTGVVTTVSTLGRFSQSSTFKTIVEEDESTGTATLVSPTPAPQILIPRATTSSHSARRSAETYGP